MKFMSPNGETHLQGNVSGKMSKFMAHEKYLVLGNRGNVVLLMKKDETSDIFEWDTEIYPGLFVDTTSSGCDVG